jgi:hypothetical protein
MSNINDNIEILSTSYINSNSKLKCKCLKDGCGNLWESSWANLSQGYGCPLCNGGSKLQIDYVKKRLYEINPDLEILSDVYINAKTSLLCKCRIHHHVWEATWVSLSNGHGCPKCSNRERLTLEEMKFKLPDINKNVIILGEYRVGYERKIIFQCLIDGYKWKAHWNLFSKSGKCPKCNKNAKKMQFYCYITSFFM